jgi:hypothetical protein
MEYTLSNPVTFVVIMKNRKKWNVKDCLVKFVTNASYDHINLHVFCAVCELKEYIFCAEAFAELNSLFTLIQYWHLGLNV